MEITYRSKCDAQLEVYNKASKSQERIITVRTLYDTHGLIYVSVSFSIDILCSTQMRNLLFFSVNSLLFSLTTHSNL